MVKQIKFNLIVDNNPIRDLEGLRNNFNIDDILRYYHNGLLEKWLNVRGYSNVLSQISSISAQDDLDIAIELVKVFEIGIEANRVEEALYSIQYHKQWQETINSNDKNNFWYQSLINDYCSDYDELLQNIIDNKHNMPLIKMSMKQISEVYLDIFKYHLPVFFDEFIKKAPLAIFASLMNPTLRKHFLSYDLVDKINSSIDFELSMSDFEKAISKFPNYFEQEFTVCSENTNRNWYDLISSGHKCLVIDMTDCIDVQVKNYDEKRNKGLTRKDAVGKVFDGLQFYSYRYSDFVKYIVLNDIQLLNRRLNEKVPIHKLFIILKNYIKIRKGYTKKYWKLVEPTGNKYMIIGMREGNFVRSMRNSGEKLSAEDVNGKFPILDGIDYMSNNPDHEIGYLEV